MCIETHVHFDATAGIYEMYVDGAVRVSATGVDTTAARGLSQIAVGVAWKDAPTTDRAIYVDEVVADTSRIPCD